MPTALPLHPALLAGLTGVLSVCVATDLRSRSIPNAVTAPAMLAGTALNSALHGVDGLLAALGGLALGLVILTPPFALGGIGGGDVKMMGAAGTFLGPALLAVAIVMGLAFGGVVAVLAAARRGRLGETLQRTWSMTAGAVATRSTEPLRRAATLPGRIVLPYSVPLALGTMAAVGWAMIARS
jgi:prepilin peptidase CpaA